MRHLRRLFINTRGVGGMEYILAMVAVIGVTIGFVSVSGGILRQGVDNVATDLARPDSLSRTVGSPDVQAPQRVLELEPGTMPHAYSGQVYGFDFISFLSAPEGTLSESLTWSLVSGTLPAGLSFVDGYISGTHSQTGPAQIIPLTVQVSDGNATVQQVYDFVAREEGIYLEPGFPDVIYSDISYSFPMATFADFPSGMSNADASWSIESGVFPPGILMSTDTGIVSGTYSSLEDYEASLSIGVAAYPYGTSEIYTFTALGRGIELASAPAYSWSGGESVNEDFSSYVTASSSVVVQDIDWDISFFEGGVEIETPAGLSIDGSVVSGVPIEADDTSWTIRVAASYEAYRDEQNYSVAYTSPEMYFIGGQMDTVRANVFYDFTLRELLVVSDDINIETVSWSIISGDLPSGLFLNTNTGRISGTHEGLYDFSTSVGFRAQLPDMRNTQKSYTLNVIGAGAVANSRQLPPIPYNKAYSFDFNETLTTRDPFDNESLTWSYSGGPIPGGISLNASTGIMSGTQSKLLDETLNLLVTATDDEDVTAQAIHSVFVDGLEPFSVASGTTSGCILDQSNVIWCYGSANSGQLGNGNTNGTLYAPTRIMDGESGADFIQVDGALSTFCGLQRDGDIWCWGGGTNGQLGDGNALDSSVPVQVVRTSMGGAKRIAVGGNHVCAIDESDEVWCWGLEQHGRLGNGETLSQENTPVKVSTVLMDDPVVGVVTGDSFSCAWDENGTGWCWGLGTSGQLGDGSNTSQSSPKAVSGLTSIEDMSAGDIHACAVVNSGTAYCWGHGGHGRLGGDAYGSSVPAPVHTSGLGTSVKSIHAGSQHTCAIDGDGYAWCWGRGDEGRVGNNSNDNFSYPQQVIATEMGPVIGLDLAHTSRFSCAWTADRKGWCWGTGNNNRLGTGNTQNQPVPAQMIIPPLP